MNPIVVITGTLTSRVTGEVVDVALGLPLVPVQVYGWAFALLLIFFFFLTVHRVQMWALNVCMILSVLYIPFSLTGYAPYVVILNSIFLFLISFVNVFVKLFKKGA